MAENTNNSKPDINDGEFEFESPTFDTSFLDSSDISDTDAEPFVPGTQNSAADDEEFIIPDGAGFDDLFPGTEYVSTLSRPYVPRFTEVTEKRNYFADQSIVREAERAAEQSRNRQPVNGTGSAAAGRTGAVASGKGGIVIERVSGVEEQQITGKIDPIAEIESAVPAAVVVNVNGSSNTKQSTINVFKFPESRENEVAQAPDDEELERREITDLTGHRWDEASSSPELDTAAEENEDEPAEIPADELIAEASESALEEERVFPDDYDYMPYGYEERESARAAQDNSEYSSPSKHEMFKDRFLDSLMSVRIRLIVGILLGLAVAIFELFSARIVDRLGLGMISNAAAFIDGALIIALIAISIPEIMRGVRALISGTVASELNALISELAMLGYTVYLALKVPSSYIFVGSVAAVIVINQIISTLYSESAAFSAFKLISDKGVKETVDIRKTRELETHNHALDGIVDEAKSRCVKSFDTIFVTGFFGNSRKLRENSRNNITVLAITLGVASVLAVAVYFLVGMAEALAGFTLVVALATPALSVLSHKLPFYFAEREAIADGTATVGEAAMYDYAATDVIIFEDTEVFGPDDVTLKSVSDKRSNYHESMRKLSSLFNAVGGPLSVVFESALGKTYDPATNVKVMDGGIAGTVDAKRLMVGTWEFMRDMGIQVPQQATLTMGSTRVIYAVEDGEFFGTFTVHYSFSEEFALMLSSMKERGIVPLVYTRDFNIDNEFMRGLTSGSDVIRVMRKYDTAKEKAPLARVNSPMVVTEDKTAVLDAVLRAKRYTQLQSWITAMEISASAAGAALAVAISLCGMTFALPMILITAWQVAWSIVLSIVSGKNFTKRKKETDDAQ